MVAGLLAFFLFTTSFCFSQEGAAAAPWPLEAESPEAFARQIRTCCQGREMSVCEQALIEGLAMVRQRWADLKEEECSIVKDAALFELAPIFKEEMANARFRRWCIIAGLAGYLCNKSLNDHLVAEILYCSLADKNAKALISWLVQVEEFARRSCVAATQTTVTMDREVATVSGQVQLALAADMQRSQ